jgi:dTDP-4-amino-4,6-dideoxygalactose transaminase
LTMTKGTMSRLQIAVNLAQWHKRSALSRAEAEGRDALIREMAGSDVFTPVGGSEEGTHFVPVLVHKLAGDPVAAVANVRRSLYADGIQTESAYPVLLSPHTAVPNAASLAARLFLLPCHSGLDEPQVQRIRLALRRAASELRRAVFDQGCRTESITPA